MTWFLVTNWAFVAAVLFVLFSWRPTSGEQMFWAGVLSLMWPLLLVFFLIGTALWAFSSAQHAIKRRRK